MKWLDWIVNLTGILLWLGTRQFGVIPVSRKPALTLASNLKSLGRKGGVRRWAFPLSLFLLLVGRALLHYWFPQHFAEAAIWSSGAVAVSFRSDFLGRMLAYSFLSWLEIVLIVYVGFGFFAGLRRNDKEPDSLTLCLRSELGMAGRWPVPLACLPFLILAGCLWMLGAGWLVDAALLPPIQSTTHRLQQAVVVALGLLPLLKWPVVALCFLRFLLDHVYLGSFPLWDYAYETGGALCRWIPLRLGLIDFAPLVVACIFFGFAFFLEEFLPQLFQRLPL